MTDPPVDLHALLQHCGGDRSLTAEILALAATELSRLDLALRSDDESDRSSTLHAVRGLAATLCAARLHAAAADEEERGADRLKTQREIEAVLGFLRTQTALTAAGSAAKRNP